MAHDSQGPSWFTTWDELPDPTSNSPFPVRLTEDALVHIVRQHLLAEGEGELWRELLGPEITDRLAQWVANRRPDPSLCEEFAAKLKPQVTDGLGRPCCNECRQKNPNGDELHATREVVTRSGMVMVIRLLPDSNVLWTAYFPRATWSERPQRRWLAAIRSRVMVYTNIVTIDGKPLVVHPDPGDQFDTDDPPGYRTDLRFVTKEKWGFRQVEIEGEILWVWKSPAPWPVP
jgi:hypothetical protein